MNDRIRELSEQAGFTVEDGHIQSLAYKQTEKLIELIVRECIRHFNEDYQRDFDTLWREDLTNSIKNHFGVE